MFKELEIVLFLLGVISVLAVLAARWSFPFSVLLVLGGLGIGVAPGLPHVEVDPDAVFLLILPPLLFSAAVMFPWRELQANLQPILGLAVGLVLVTMTAVAYASWWIIPGMTLAAGFVLGAIVSPPDAVAANSILGRLSVPRRIQTILEGESLVNDASGLVAWKFAVAAMVTGAFSLREATGQFFIIGIGGVALGFVLSWLLCAILRRVGEPVVELTLFLMTPYLVYVVAELVDVSGVLAVVTAGMVIGSRMDEVFSSRARLDSAPVWGFVQHLLNSIVFIIIGLQFPAIMKGLHLMPWEHIALCLFVVVGVVVAVRFAWFFLLSRLLYLDWVQRRLLLRRRSPAPKRELFVMSWCGMRGVVSMAAALAVPEYLENGEPVAQRDFILFLTFGVIFFTLIVPSITLPSLVRRLRLASSDVPRHEEMLKRSKIARHGREVLERIVASMGIDAGAPVVSTMREHFEMRERRYEKGMDWAADPSIDPAMARQLVSAVIADMRAFLRGLGEQGEIDEHLRAKIRRELDAEELRLLHIFGG